MFGESFMRTHLDAQKYPWRSVYGCAGGVRENGAMCGMKGGQVDGMFLLFQRCLENSTSGMPPFPSPRSLASLSTLHGRIEY